MDPTASLAPVSTGFQRCTSEQLRTASPRWQELVESGAEVPFFMGGSWLETWIEVFGDALSPRMFHCERDGAWLEILEVIGHRVHLTRRAQQPQTVRPDDADAGAAAEPG